MCIFAQKCIIVKKKFNMKKKLVFATNNAHKLEEIRAILGDKVKVLSLKDIRCEADIPETADTLEGNAALKAEYIHAHYGMDCFADDTGLEVEALDGAPGVYSARYAGGEGHDSEANMKKLLAEQEAWDKSLRAMPAQKLTTQANEWLADNDQTDRDPEKDPITEDEFARRILLTEFTVSPGGRFTAWYEDDDMFWGHVITVDGTLKKGPVDADIQG